MADASTEQGLKQSRRWRQRAPTELLTADFVDALGLRLLVVDAYGSPYARAAVRVER
jgi:hypothetical protein